MTFIIERYQDTESETRFASIEQDKYCTTYNLVVYRVFRDNPSHAYHVMPKRTYISVANARKAMRKLGQWEKVYDMKEGAK